METKVHSAKTKHWVSFYIPRSYDIQRQMNKQSGFNAGQIEKDNYPESKNHLKMKLKMKS